MHSHVGHAPHLMPGTYDLKSLSAAALIDEAETVF